MFEISSEERTCRRFVPHASSRQAGRRKAQATTKTGQAAGATVVTRHYTDDSDNPSWVDTGNGRYERYTDSVSGSLGAMLDQDGKANMALLDPNGNTATTVEIPAMNGSKVGSRKN